ncbi:cyclophilin-like domain-containing protein [Pelagophyceae sp. CCMP2097]|nr:cyclophilin-like domain-containing protein [Pelagophyceae sp. CCMP2097]
MSAMVSTGSRAAQGGDIPPFVVFETSVGDFVVELYTAHAPLSCKNFAELARSGYYDGTIFHRVIRGFMIQAGDPSGTGRGGASIYGAKFQDEITRDLKHTGAGVLSMANSGPNTNGSQFFVTLAPTPWLDGKHSVFGRIASGMGTIKKLGMVAVDSGDRPLGKVTVHRAYPQATATKPTASPSALAMAR